MVSSKHFMNFVAADLLPGLLSQANSLRLLIIINTRNLETVSRDEPVLGFLSGFQALECLALPATVILGPPPESLDFDKGVCQNPLGDLLPPQLVTPYVDVVPSQYQPCSLQMLILSGSRCTQRSREY